MKKITISLPMLALLVWTRGMGTAGVALLNADRLTREQRRAVGWTLFFVGALTTLPLAIEILGKRGPQQMIRT